MSQIPARIFHHLDEFDAEIVNHRPVHLNHLLGCEVRDEFSIKGNVHFVIGN